MWPHTRADQVVGTPNVRHPVPHRLVHRVLQGPGPRSDRMDRGAEEAHPVDVQPLSLSIDLAHVDLNREAENCACHRRRNTVLPGPGLGDEPAFAHELSEQPLAEGVV